jgi:hypothetical protein
MKREVIRVSWEFHHHETHMAHLEHVWITFSPMTKISQAKKL